MAQTCSPYSVQYVSQPLRLTTNGGANMMQCDKIMRETR